MSSRSAPCALIDQVVNPTGHNAQDFWVRTLAERDRGCDPIGCHQGHPGRLYLDFPDNQLAFMQGHNAPPGGGL